MLFFIFFRGSLLGLLDSSVHVVNLFLYLLLLELEQCLFLDGGLQLLLDLLDPLIVLLEHVLDLLDVIRYRHLLAINTILVRLVEIPLLA